MFMYSLLLFEGNMFIYKDIKWVKIFLCVNKNWSDS